jgi:hypothetical protein
MSGSSDTGRNTSRQTFVEPYPKGLAETDSFSEQEDEKDYWK